jgi:hypothetical protein
MEKDNEFERDSKKAIHRSMCFNKRSFEEKIINLVESKAASADGK